MCVRGTDLLVEPQAQREAPAVRLVPVLGAQQVLVEVRQGQARPEVRAQHTDGRQHDGGVGHRAWGGGRGGHGQDPPCAVQAAPMAPPTLLTPQLSRGTTPAPPPGLYSQHRAWWRQTHGENRGADEPVRPRPFASPRRSWPPRAPRPRTPHL